MCYLSLCQDLTHHALPRGPSKRISTRAHVSGPFVYATADDSSVIV